MPPTVRFSGKEPRFIRRSVLISRPMSQMERATSPAAKNRTYMAASDRIRKHACVSATCLRRSGADITQEKEPLSTCAAMSRMPVVPR